MAGSKSRGIGTGAAVRRIARPVPAPTATPATPAGTITADDAVIKPQVEDSASTPAARCRSKEAAASSRPCSVRAGRQSLRC